MTRVLLLILAQRSNLIFLLFFSSVADTDPVRMVLGLLDPDPLLRGTDRDPSFIKQNSKKNIDSYCFVTFFDFLTLENDVF
jgi:hypothetical protein